jgi:hypothetical protein
MIGARDPSSAHPRDQRHRRSDPSFLEAPIVKVRDARPEELAPKPRKEKALSPRQIAIRKREQAIDKVLNELGAGSASMIKRVELDEGEKLVTIRAAIVKRIKESKSSVRLAVRNGGIFLSRGSIPRTGGGRPPKNG